MEHIFSAKSLKQGQLPGLPPPLVAGLVTLQLFQNASLEFPWFSRIFSRVWCCIASLNKNSSGTNITCNLTRHCGLLQVRIELSVFL